MGYARVGSMAMFVGTAVHLFISYYFVLYLKWGIVGTAIATTITNITTMTC